MQKNEYIILVNLIKNESFMRKAIPFFKVEYFTTNSSRKIFEVLSSYVEKYNKCPSFNSLSTELENVQGNESEYKEIQNDVESLKNDNDDYENSWLVDTAEKFCKDRALYNALYDCIQIADKNNKTDISTANIPDILTKALNVSFDVNVGHDYVENCVDRYKYYHRKEEKIPFDIDLMNKITDGGIPKKTLSIIAAETGKGKSIWLCHHAANCLKQNKNVLYITLEMSEERIAERIDANLMNIPLIEMRKIDTEFEFTKRFARATNGIKGKLIIKEYPTSTASVLNFRALLDELEIKRGFIPDIIIVDYINLCLSSRYKANANANSYTLIKAIAEELRGLAVEKNVQLFSATQLNRSGFKNTDVDLTHVAESIGLPATADFFFALITTDQLDALNQVLFKQLKNRFNDINIYGKFVVGLDKPKMRFYNVSESAQDSIIQENTTEKETETEFDNENEVAPFSPNSKFNGWS